MNIKFTFIQNIILTIILFNIVSASYIPGLFFSEKFNYFIQIFIFSFVTLLCINVRHAVDVQNFRLKFKLIVSCGIIIFFLLSSFYFNLSFNLSIVAIAKLISYPIIIYFFFIYFPRLINRNHLLFEKLLNYWLYFSIFTVIISLMMLLLGLNFNQKTQSTVGFFYYSNIFAFIFTFTVPILFYKYFTKQISLYSFAIQLFLSLTCLLYTYSRAGYIGVLVGILIITFRKSKLLTSVIIIFLFLISSSVVMNFAAAKGSSSFLSRVQVMYIGYTMITNGSFSEFLWGYGVFNNVEVFQNALKNTFGYAREETSPHNFILTLMIQFGALLTIIVLLYIMAILIKALLIKKSKVDSMTIQKINLSVSVVLGLLFQNMFEDVLVYPEFFVMPFFLIFLGYLNQIVFNKEKGLKTLEKF